MQGSKRKGRRPGTWELRVDAGARIAGVIALLVVGSILVTRRVAGAFNTHLPTLPLLATIVLTAMVILGGRVAWRLTSPPRRREQLQFREQLVGPDGVGAGHQFVEPDEARHVGGDDAGGNKLHAAHAIGEHRQLRRAE